MATPDTLGAGDVEVLGASDVEVQGAKAPALSASDVDILSPNDVEMQGGAQPQPKAPAASGFPDLSKVAGAVPGMGRPATAAQVAGRRTPQPESVTQALADPTTQHNEAASTFGDQHEPTLQERQDAAGANYGFDPLKGIGDVARGARKISEGIPTFGANPQFGVFPTKEQKAAPVNASTAAEGANEVLGGTMEAGTGAFGEALARKPIQTALSLAAGYVSGDVAAVAAKKAGATPEEQEFAKTLAFFIPNAVATAAGVRTTEVAGPNGTRGAGVSAFGGRVGVGGVASEEAVGVGARVGPFSAQVVKPRGGGVEFSSNGPARLPDPGTSLAQEEAAATSQAIQQANALDAAAKNVAQGKPPIPQPPEPPKPEGMEQGVLKPETVQRVAQAISMAPAAARGQLVMEAHERLANWIAQQGRVMGPDGKIAIAKTPEQAQTIAAKWINDEVARQDQARNEAQKAQEQQQKEAAKSQEKAAQKPEVQQPPTLQQRAQTLIESSEKEKPEQVAKNIVRTLGIRYADALDMVKQARAGKASSIETGGLSITPEQKQAIDTQMDALKRGDVKAIHLPPESGYVPALPEGIKRVDVRKGPGAGTYLYKAGEIRAQTIRAAAEAGTHEDLLAGKPLETSDVEVQPATTAKVEAAPAQPERRSDLARRQRVAEMSPEQLRSELLTSEKTGLPNRRAFDEAEHAQPAGAVAQSDADGLKALNDKFGYAAGDALLKAKAEALRDAGLEAYHEKGDEFLYRGETPEGLQQKLEQARQILRDRTIKATLPDGTVRYFKGADFSYGTGSNLAESEAGLKAHKSEREARGERARGELRGIAEAAQGNEDRSAAQPAEEVKPTKYEYGNTQAAVPEGSEAHTALATARAKIDKADLISTGYGGNDEGLETEPHVTLRYGLKGDDTAGIRAYLEKQAPFEATLGKTTSFPPSKSSDGGAPIIAPVEAPELRRIESELDRHGDFIDRAFPEYKPHATLAYVKPEAAKKYEGMTETEGKRFRVESIVISNRDGSKETVPLKGKASEGTNGVRPAAEGAGGPAAPREGAGAEKPAAEAERPGQPENALAPKSEAAQSTVAKGGRGESPEPHEGALEKGARVSFTDRSGQEHTGTIAHTDGRIARIKADDDKKSYSVAAGRVRVQREAKPGRYGEVGREFVATHMTPNAEVMPIGTVLPPNGEATTLKVIGYDGKTAVGKSQWYRFRVVPSSEYDARPQRIRYLDKSGKEQTGTVVRRTSLVTTVRGDDGTEQVVATRRVLGMAPEAAAVQTKPQFEPGQQVSISGEGFQTARGGAVADDEGTIKRFVPAEQNHGFNKAVIARPDGNETQVSWAAGAEPPIRVKGAAPAAAPKPEAPPAEPTVNAQATPEQMAETERALADLRTQQDELQKQYQEQGGYAGKQAQELLRQLRELTSQILAHEDDLARMRGEPTRAERKAMQKEAAEKPFSQRPEQAMTYADPEQSQHWQVLEKDYIEKRFEQDAARYERGVKEKDAELEKLKPETKAWRDATLSRRAWQTQLNRLRERDPVQAQQYKHEYLDLVKKAVSKGSPVPDAVIRQKSEFKIAQTARERYEKGRHTSFANRSAAINDTMQKDDGFKVKRQDGKEITPEQIKEIQGGVDDVVKVLGPELRDAMRGTDLTIAHTNGKHPFLSDAGGEYHPAERSISAGIADELGKPVRALAHEMGHWLDYESGKLMGKEAKILRSGKRVPTHYASEVDRDQDRYAGLGSRPDTLYSLALKTMTDTRQVIRMLKTVKTADLPPEERVEIERVKVELGHYWREPRELFARLFEQYVATKLGRGGLASNSPEDYQKAPAWWSKEAWAKLEPMVEAEIAKRMDALRDRYSPKAEPVKLTEEVHGEPGNRSVAEEDRGEVAAGGRGEPERTEHSGGTTDTDLFRSGVEAENRRLGAEANDYGRVLSGMAHILDERDIAPREEYLAKAKEWGVSPFYIELNDLFHSPLSSYSPERIGPEEIGRDLQAYLPDRAPISLPTYDPGWRHAFDMGRPAGRMREELESGRPADELRKIEKEADAIHRKADIVHALDGASERVKKAWEISTAAFKTAAQMREVAEASIRAAEQKEAEKAAEEERAPITRAEQVQPLNALRVRPKEAWNKDAAKWLTGTNWISDGNAAVDVSAAEGKPGERAAEKYKPNPSAEKNVKPADLKRLAEDSTHDAEFLGYRSREVTKSSERADVAYFAVGDHIAMVNAHKLRMIRSIVGDKAKVKGGTSENDPLVFHKGGKTVALLMGLRDPEPIDIETARKTLAERSGETEYLHGGIGAVIPANAFARAAGPVLRFLNVPEEYETVRTSRDLQQSLYDLDAQANADVLRAKRLLEEAPGTASDSEAVYHHLEDPNLPLTPTQQKLLDEYVAPLMEDTAEKVRLMREDGAVIENYVHRIVKGRGNFIDRLLAGSKSTGKGNVLRKHIPSEKSRTMMALESNAGNRVVVSIKGDRVTAYRQGREPQDMGALSSGLTTRLEQLDQRLEPVVRDILKAKEQIAEVEQRDREDYLAGLEERIDQMKRDRDLVAEVKGRVPGQQSAHGVEVSFNKRASLSRQIEKAEKELEAYRAGTAEVQLSNRAKERIRRLNETLEVLRNQRGRLLEQVPTERMADKVWEDRNGKTWKITQATTKEIEAVTNLEYYHNALGSAIINWLAVEKQFRATEFLKNFTENPDFARIGLRMDAGQMAPEGWRTTELAQLRGYYFEPHIAEVLDWYADRLKARQPGIYEKINNFLISSIFFNPLLHVPNILNHWAVEKGVSGWLDPRQKPAQVRAMVKAINAVIHQNDDFLAALDAGAALQSQQFGTHEYADLFLKRMQQQIEQEPTLWEKTAKLLGYANPLKMLDALKAVSSRVTWYSNDIAFLQSAYEKMARGMDLKVALRETAKHIPDYRLPTRILDSEGLARTLGNTKIVMFMHYHYGALRSYGEMLKSLATVGWEEAGTNAKGEPVNASGRTQDEEKQHGLDILAMLGLVTLVVYPLVDKMLRKASGDPNATMRRAGASTLPYNILQVARGEKSVPDALQSLVTPAVGLKAATELAMNQDLHTGRHIYTYPTDDWERTMGQVGSRLTQSFGPANELQRAGREGWTRDLAGMAGVTFPEHGAMKIASEIAANDADRKALSSDERAALNARYKALDALRAGDRNRAEELMRQAGLTRRQRHNLAREAHEDPLLAKVQHFTVEDLKTVYKHATAEERIRLGRLLRDKERRQRTESRR